MENVISIDKPTSDKLKNLLSSLGVDADVLRIFMSGMGCSGAMFNIAKDQLNEDDLSVDFDGIKYVVQKDLAKEFEGFDIINIEQYGDNGLFVKPRKMQESSCSSCGGGCH